MSISGLSNTQYPPEHDLNEGGIEARSFWTGDDNITVFWKKLHQKLSENIPYQFFNAFFNDLQPIVLEEDHLVLHCSDERVTTHLESRYREIIMQYASQIQNRPIRVSFQSNRQPAHAVSRRSSVPDQDRYNNHRFSKPKNYFIPLNPNYVFERFVKGPSNQHAYTACKGISEKPQGFHNPFYLYGGVGLGKTHLLMAIGNEIKASYPWLKAKYTPAESFKSDLLESLKNNSLNNFKSAYRSVDIFLFDDIQLISPQSEFTQEELFNTFNYIYQNHKQIVISSDQPAQRLPALKDRLISRFQSGLIIDIKPPNLATRISIVNKKSSEMQLAVSEDVVHYLAENITSQIRLMEAALTKLDFLSRSEKIPIDLNMAQEILKDLPLGLTREEIKVDKILGSVADVFKIGECEMKGESQSNQIALVRHTAMYLCKKLIPDIPMSYIASIFGRNDHTTVMYAYKKISKLIERDPSFKKKLDQITNKIRLD